jgi:hypothetical protein
LPSNTASSGVSAGGVNNQDCPGWWNCHWVRRLLSSPHFCVRDADSLRSNGLSWSLW